jgi:hypothetical protein
LLLGVVAALAGAQDLETCAGPATSSELKAATFGGGDGYNADDRPGVALTRRSRPTPPPENVTVAFHLYDVVKIDATAQQVTVTGYVRYAWKDWRLAYDDACAESLTFAGSEASKVWSPSVFITPLIEDLVSTDRTHALNVASDGTVSYSTKRQLTFKCAMDFKKMPRDTQRCDIVFRTFRETTDDVACAPSAGRRGAPRGFNASVSRPHASKESIRTSRTRREMLARPKMSRNEREGTERGASKGEKKSPVSPAQVRWRALLRRGLAHRKGQRHHGLVALQHGRLRHGHRRRGGESPENFDVRGRRRRR